MQLLSESKDNYLKLKMLIFRGVKSKMLPTIFDFFFLTFHLSLDQLEKLVFVFKMCYWFIQMLIRNLDLGIE